MRSEDETASRTNLESDGAFGLCTRNTANGELIIGEVLAFGKFQSAKTEVRGRDSIGERSQDTQSKRNA